MQKMLLMKNRCFYEKIREKVLQKSKNDSKKKLGKKIRKKNSQKLRKPGEYIPAGEAAAGR